MRVSMGIEVMAKLEAFPLMAISLQARKELCALGMDESFECLEIGSTV